MKTHKHQWFALLAGAALALGIPASAIWKQHRVATQGEAIKLLLRPVDPYDPFRGRFVALDFQDRHAAPAEPSSSFAARDTAFLAIEVDADGFAKPHSLHRSPPADTLYLKVSLGYRHDDQYLVSYPFNRYYLNEKDAPRAEALAREAMRLRPSNQVEESQASTPPSYVIVRVYKGEAALEALYVAGRPIEELLAESSR